MARQRCLAFLQPLHVHLDDDSCMEVTALQGSSGNVLSKDVATKLRPKAYLKSRRRWSHVRSGVRNGLLYRPNANDRELHRSRQGCGILERDEFRMNRHRALAYCLSMISAQTLRVCREGKPVSTFPDHARAERLRLRRAASAFERSTRGPIGPTSLAPCRSCPTPTSDAGYSPSQAQHGGCCAILRRL